jgi:hypothetical protein
MLPLYGGDQTYPWDILLFVASFLVQKDTPSPNDLCRYFVHTIDDRQFQIVSAVPPGGEV